MCVGSLELAKRHAIAVAPLTLLVGVLGAKYLTRTGDEMDCLRATEGDAGRAVVVCEREYEATRVPATGVRLANALRRTGGTGNMARAKTLATELLTTSARADALTVLGRIASDARRFDEALERLRDARRLHLAERKPERAAGDDQALAGVFRAQKQYAEALRALDDCILDARRGADRSIEGYCHMSAGLVLGEVGYFEGAQAELALAAPMLKTDRQLAALEIERAALQQRHAFATHRRDENKFAILHLKRAIEHAQRAARTADVLTAELNLAYSLAEVGETAEATTHLERARVLDVRNTDVAEFAALEARIAYRAGDGALATTINTAVYDELIDKLVDDDRRLELCVMQARIAMAANDLEAAKVWAARGVKFAELTRKEVSAIELRPWVLSVRRQPHELLFAALVRSRKLEDAVVTFDQWQARTLLDSSVRDRRGRVDLRAAAGDTERYHRVFPMLSSAQFVQPIERAELLGQLRAVDVVALVVADGEVWRIASRHGALEIVSVGSLAALRSELSDFAAAPTNPDLGESLGVKLLGSAAFDSGETLYAVLDGQLAGVPIAALRKAGRPLVAIRPVVRAPRLSQVGCIPPHRGPRRAVVLADARGDLPEAAREANEIATRFGVAAAIGAAATSDALFTGTKGGLLHLAVHANVELGAGTLLLHDRQVSALEIAGRGDGPSLVMLSVCLSAVSDDGEQATSLANAFLAAGSAQVVATLRPVTDAGARELTHRFYQAGIIAPRWVDRCDDARAGRDPRRDPRRPGTVAIDHSRAARAAPGTAPGDRWSDRACAVLAGHGRPRDIRGPARWRRGDRRGRRAARRRGRRRLSRDPRRRAPR
jgi:tetratricopeptide (TPR) repeat protein